MESLAEITWWIHELIYFQRKILLFHMITSSSFSHHHTIASCCFHLEFYFSHMFLWHPRWMIIYMRGFFWTWKGVDKTDIEKHLNLINTLLLSPYRLHPPPLLDPLDAFLHLMCFSFSVEGLCAVIRVLHAYVNYAEVHCVGENH
jgi:hypothetical protein